MNTFLKTFFICLIITLSFLMYRFVSDDSYTKDLEVSKQNPIFGLHEEEQNPQKDIELPAKKPNIPQEPDIKPPVEEKNPPPEQKTEKYTHTCYFFSNNGQLVPVKRELILKPTLENTITMLLKGPTIAETKKGMYSEIPANVDLIWVKRQDNTVTVNLSSNFGNGGGSQSVENRIQQLTKTVKMYEPKKNIYLYINGKEVEYLGGDGVYIKQPLNY